MAKAAELTPEQEKLAVVRVLLEQAITDLTHAQIHLDRFKSKLWAIKDKL